MDLQDPTPRSARATRGHAGVYLAFIFLTGAVTLALELLASRVMTPYFGVSLYIWTGILSITLVALSLGYYLGGRLTGTGASERVGRLEFHFLLMPALSSLAISVSCLAYPITFSALAGFSLVVGSLVACMVLLFAPLVAVSAMNPLLIAIQRFSGSSTEQMGDSGSGLVFFTSTVGSVIGVFVTAFVFIPNFTNFNSIVFLAIVLAAISLLGTLRPGAIQPGQRRSLRVAGSAALAVGVAILSFSSTYLKKEESIAFGGNLWTIEREYTSLFGNTKIIAIRPPGQDRNVVRVMTNDGLTMNTVDAWGRSLSPFTYALEYMAVGLRPDAAKVLVLGLGAGVVPMRMAARGAEVDVVEINPDYLDAAVDYFDFDPTKARVIETDARTFVRDCREEYDVVVLDLFQGDGVPDYLLTREFFADVAGCMGPSGVAVFNTLAAVGHLDVYYDVVKTVRAELPALLMFHEEVRTDRVELNVYLAAARTELVWDFELPREKLPPAMAENLRRVFARPRPLDAALLERATVIRDESNTFAFTNGPADIVHRRSTLQSLPAEFRTN